jgi:WD40 repeat protein
VTTNQMRWGVGWCVVWGLGGSEWDVSALECACVLEAHSDEVLFVAGSHDGRRFVTTSKDRTAILWCIDAVVGLLFA